MNPLFSVRGAKEIRFYLERCERGGVLASGRTAGKSGTRLKRPRRIRYTLTDSGQTGKNSYSELYTLRELVPGNHYSKKISRMKYLAVFRKTAV
jgi:DNA mismatch repair protein MutS2